jgi:hypothetical protein
MIPKSGTACDAVIILMSHTRTHAHACARVHTHTHKNCGGHDLNTGQSGIGERWRKEIMRDKAFIHNYLSVAAERWCVKWWNLLCTAKPILTRWWSHNLSRNYARIEFLCGSEKLQSVIGWIGMDIPKDYSAFIFRVKQFKQQTKFLECSQIT